MVRYEYKVVPAPEQGKKGKGVKGTAGRFANALESLMNALAAEGWEYLRADTLPCEERIGLTGRTTTYQNLLVFRRAAAEDAVAEPVGPALAAPQGAGGQPPALRRPNPAGGQAGSGGSGRPSAPPQRAPTASAAAAAAAAAALSAYRENRPPRDDSGTDLAAE